MRREAQVARDVAREAAALILGVYATPFEVDFKVGDDPVTRADREANDYICAELARAYPGMPIVAEESDPASYAGFSKSSHVWFVDPLDGTREFVARNGEFAVMIGLAEHGRAVLGVVEAVEANPASDLLVLDGGRLVPLRFVVEHTRGARIIVDVVRAPQPPRRLLLGAQAVVMAREAAAVRAAELEQWADISRAADFPSEQ